MLGTKAGPTVRGVSIHELVKACVNRRYMVPPLQRPPVWGPRDQQRLLASVLAGRPIGSILLVERIFEQHGGGQAVAVGDRIGLDGGRVASPTDPALDDEGTEPEAFVLDGQQRLIALMSGFQSPTRRGRRATVLDRARIWCVDLKRFVETLASMNPEHQDSFVAFEKSIRWVDPSRRKQPPPTVATIAAGCAAEAMSSAPNRKFFVQLGMLLESGNRVAAATDNILSAFVEWCGMSSGQPERQQLARKAEVLLRRIRDYRVPVCRIDECTDVEAASAFEQLNTSGEPLDTSDVAYANIFVRDPGLRRLLRQLEGDVRGSIAGIKSNQLLDACICAGAPEGGAIPDLGKRSVLRLARDVDQVDRIRAGAERIREAMPVAEELLRECGIRDFQSSPVPTVSVALLAGLARHSDCAALARVGTERLLIHRWWWKRTLDATRYGWRKNWLGRLVRNWAPTPRVTRDAWDDRGWRLSDFHINPRKERVGAKAKVLATLLRTAGLMDFLSFKPGMVAAEDLDLHHVFPKAWLAKMQRASGTGDLPEGDCFANLTLINSDTNRNDIRDKAPREYVAKLVERLGVTGGRVQLARVLAQHGIDIDLLEGERFAEFLEHRCDWYDRRLAEVDVSLAVEA